MPVQDRDCTGPRHFAGQDPDPLQPASRAVTQAFAVCCTISQALVLGIVLVFPEAPLYKRIDIGCQEGKKESTVNFCIIWHIECSRHRQI